MLANLMNFFAWINEGAGWAAWAQAFGSVAAIWYAGRFSHRDRLRIAVDRMATLNGIAQVAVKLCDRAEKVIDDRANNPDNGPIDAFPLFNFEDAEELLKSVPVSELGSTQAPDIILRLRNHIRAMRTVVQGQIAQTAAPSADVVFRARAYASDARKCGEQISTWVAERQKRADTWWR
jgi:hypothetical protein